MGRSFHVRMVHCDPVRLSEEQADEYETLAHPASGDCVRLYVSSSFFRLSTPHFSDCFPRCSCLTSNFALIFIMIAWTDLLFVPRFLTSSCNSVGHDYDPSLFLVWVGSAPLARSTLVTRPLSTNVTPTCDPTPQSNTLNNRQSLSSTPPWTSFASSSEY